MSTTKEQRADRLRTRAARLTATANASIASAREIGSHIPMGQPILVGHHSERKHRRDIARIDAKYTKGFEDAKEAGRLNAQADRVEASTVVYSDDPDAIETLRANLAEAEHRQATIVDVNKRLRAGASLAEVAPLLSFWTNAIRKLVIIQSLGHKTIPTTNGGAEIRRLKSRIVELGTKAATPSPDPVVVGECRIEEGENRVRVIFPDKPDDAMRAKLKGAGFRWAPSSGAWQRHASPGAWYAARQILGVVS